MVPEEDINRVAEQVAAASDTARGSEIDGLSPSSNGDEKDIEPAEYDDSEPDTTYDIIKPQVHELNAHLLFAPFDDDTAVDGLRPYFGLVSAYEPDLEAEFDAAGTTWRIDHPDDHPDANKYGKATLGYWEGAIATRENDSGDAFLEYQFPVYDTADAEKRNRRINFQFRPALPEAEHAETGDRIRSLPDDLPEGVRVQVQAANVEPEIVVDVLQGLANAIGLQASYFARSELTDWSRITGLAYYVRLKRELAEQHLISPEALFERLAQFCRQRHGAGELKWDNGDVYGKRHALTLDPTQLSDLYGSHAVAKLLKSYLPKHASEEVAEGDTLQHPKLEVQYNRSYTPFGGHLPWFDDHADDGDDGRPPWGRETLEQRLQEYLVNAITWSDIPRRPDDAVYVPDDHFQVERIDQDLADDLRLVPDPIEKLVEQERDIVVSHLLEDPPTDAERDVLRTAADGGYYGGLEELADDADVSSSTVSRCIRKFDRLFVQIDGLSLADDVIRQRVKELLTGLENRLETVTDGLQRLASGEREIPEDSVLHQWAKRYGAQIERVGRGAREHLKIAIAGANLTQRDLLEVLRAGYDAADNTPGVDIAEFASAAVAYYDEHGDRRDIGEWVGVNQGGRTRLLGKREVDALH